METKILISEEEIDFSTMVKKFVTISIHQMVANISVVALSYTFAQNVFLPIMLNTLAREVLHRLRVQRLNVMSLILAVSSPHQSENHCSINDLIDKDTCSMSYVKIDDAIDIILKYGRN